ncbi:MULTISPECIES: DUF2325 domain-containing protein [Bacillales]|jgi:hypothetical protein|uniref:Dihydroorotate dehydrogenase n=1 Tax=Brevibacillus aydinogluensis TaxID=927786 RepID=A0AA48M5L5_9BACL|nr:MULTISPECIES: DUF2325 domain-containing protein [Bacillales]REK61265.1 MAG: dihydroorotate dehydrogenase [Brevibacillus sp.]MBR8660928.1 DUF2325 domain-containing protein [Brevibacillus sp. NL20B1]MDT3416957.1 hypothetical protein [Brevibacillus aydinogluensis]NNV04345.1 DUF2325 domain-containing protein [Brevibacillus sp. MCWH]UFJ61435.1 DUF2325 domain-containing protein [Anoxybacillus sediminis]
MSSILVIGGDRLGNIVDFLQNQGFTEIHHVTGRKSSQTGVKIPTGVHMILVLTDFVNHNLAKTVKNQAKDRELPIVFCKRSCAAIAKALLHVA